MGNSGALDKKEFRLYLKNLGFGNDLQTTTLQALADDDNDGTISFEEFKKFVKVDNAKKLINDCNEFQFLCAVRDIFKKYDDDGNGTITWGMEEGNEGTGK